MKRGRVLIVDDEPLILNLASAVLRGQGLVVTTASDGQTALQLCLSEDFDVVLTDVVMPYMDGPAFVRELNRKNRTVPTLFMSGFNNGDDLSENAILRKPFTNEQLIHAVDSRLPADRRAAK